MIYIQEKRAWYNKSYYMNFMYQSPKQTGVTLPFHPNVFSQYLKYYSFVWQINSFANFYFVINFLMSFTIAFMSQLLTIYHFAMLKSSITFIVKQTVLIRNLLLESNTFTTCIYTYLHHYIYILMCPQSFQIRPKFCNI